MKKIDTLGEWINQAAGSLSSITDTPQLEAQVLAAFLLDKPRSWILSHPENILPPDESKKLNFLLSQRQKGKPLPYIIGSWEFYSLSFLVTDDVLIPRPETERLVSEALAWINSHPDCREVLDVGTGSACIAISLLVNAPNIHVTGVDISRPALKIAKRNASRHGSEGRLGLVHSDLLTNVSGRFDLICANLPYIPTSTLTKLPIYTHEPQIALDGGEDGFKLISTLLSQIKDSLFSTGLILLEIESGQSDLAWLTAQKYFPHTKIHIINDYAGLPRLLRIEV